MKTNLIRQIRSSARRFWLFVPDIIADLRLKLEIGWVAKERKDNAQASHFRNNAALAHQHGGDGTDAETQASQALFGSEKLRSRRTGPSLRQVASARPRWRRHDDQSHYQPGRPERRC